MGVDETGVDEMGVDEMGQTFIKLIMWFQQHNIKEYKRNHTNMRKAITIINIHLGTFLFRGRECYSAPAEV